MVRKCKGICYRTQDVFTTKQLSYDEGSYCRICEVWIKQPTNSKLDIYLVGIPTPHDENYQYYDIEGQRRNLQVLLPIKLLVKKIRCKCCGTQARGKSHHTERLRNKIFSTLKREPKVDRAPRGISEKSRLKQQVKNRHTDDEEGVFALEGELELYNLVKGENKA
jgi:hypothetical protein